MSNKLQLSTDFITFDKVNINMINCGLRGDANAMFLACWEMEGACENLLNKESKARKVLNVRKRGIGETAFVEVKENFPPITVPFFTIAYRAQIDLKEYWENGPELVLAAVEAGARAIKRQEEAKVESLVGKSLDDFTGDKVGIMFIRQPANGLQILPNPALLVEFKYEWLIFESVGMILS